MLIPLIHGYFRGGWEVLIFTVEQANCKFVKIVHSFYLQNLNVRQFGYFLS